MPGEDKCWYVVMKVLGCYSGELVWWDSWYWGDVPNLDPHREIKINKRIKHAAE